jgi:hypothetical protein
MGAVSDNQIVEQMVVDAGVELIEQQFRAWFNQIHLREDRRIEIRELARQLGGPQEITDERADRIAEKAARAFYRLFVKTFDKWGGDISWSQDAAEVVGDEDDKITQRIRRGKALSA